MRGLHRIISIVSKLRCRFVLKQNGVLYGKGCHFYGKLIVSKYRGSTISLGNRVSCISSSTGTALGVRAPVILRTLSSTASLAIGNDSGMSGAVICAALSVTVGDRCLIGADVMIFDTDFHMHAPENRRYATPIWSQISAPVVIRDDVFIGTRATICKGTTIGEGAIVAAGSVVTNDVPPFAVVAGNPAKVVKMLSRGGTYGVE